MCLAEKKEDREKYENKKSMMQLMQVIQNTFL